MSDSPWNPADRGILQTWAFLLAHNNPQFCLVLRIFKTLRNKLMWLGVAQLLKHGINSFSLNLCSKLEWPVQTMLFLPCFYRFWPKRDANITWADELLTIDRPLGNVKPIHPQSAGNGPMVHQFRCQSWELLSQFQWWSQFQKMNWSDKSRINNQFQKGATEIAWACFI